MTADTLSGRRWIGGIVGLVGFALVALAHAGECRGGDKRRADAKPAEVIDAIVSRNKAPKIVDWKAGELRWAALFPEGYDWKEEERVRRAVEQLKEDATEEVWEELVKRIGDRRYCQTVITAIVGNARVLDVGTVCERLAWARLVNVYWKHLPEEGLGAKQPNLDVVGDLARWRKQRAGKPLYELQIEVCEAAIKALNAKPGERVPDADKRRFQKKVEAEIAKLKKAKKPVHALCSFWFVEEWGVYNEKIAAQVRKGVKTGKYDPSLIYK